MKYRQTGNIIRQKLISTGDSSWPMAKNPIDTLKKLKAHLQIAIKIELATIPPYLCALYSIKERTNIIPAQIIQSVVMEEMLHLCMASNLLNAIGGSPVIDESTTLNYPDFLPHNDGRFKVGLLKFSKEAIDTFLLIEKPDKDCPPPTKDKFHSIGQFYSAVRYALEDLEKEYQKKGKTIFTGKANKQITPEHYYGSGGKLIAVNSLSTAKLAIEEIVGQGEGIDGSISDGDPGTFGADVELAHYFRFMEVAAGRFFARGDSAQGAPTGTAIDVDWDSVYNMQANPKIASFKRDPDLYKKALAFNKTYGELLNNINGACNGDPALLGQGIPLMYALKYQAIELMKIPVGNDGSTAGPTFELGLK